MNLNLKRAFPVLSLLCATTLAAQAPSDANKKNEVGLVIGPALTPGVGLQSGQQITFNSSFALGAEYDYRIFKRKTIGVSAGVDFLASPNDVFVSNPPPNVSPQYAYLFLTPHVRVTLRPDAPIRPWLLFGGGYANYAPSTPAVPLVQVQGGGSTNTFVFGGGVDTKPLITLPSLPILGALPVGARVEVKDFYAGQANFGVPTTSSRQNTVAFTGGLLLHF